jgi:hypothetical protein
VEGAEGVVVCDGEADTEEEEGRGVEEGEVVSRGASPSCAGAAAAAMVAGLVGGEESLGLGGLGAGEEDGSLHVALAVVC